MALMVAGEDRTEARRLQRMADEGRLGRHLLVNEL
jgi:hypothetical protein